MRVLVTGASGFVGGAVVRRLVADGAVVVRAAVRRPDVPLAEAVEQMLVGDLSAQTDWRAALRDVDVVVHAAARVHVMRDASVDPLAEFRRVNVAGTMRLAGQAAEAGVRRFVFLSSIKVNGEGTVVGRPYSAADVPAPVDPYGVSKREAEDGLRELALSSGMEVAIIRPVLVYGSGVKGNFRSLLRLMRIGVPLPLGAIRNRRSLVALDNLVDLIARTIRHPGAANQTFLVSDGDALSTTELLTRVAASFGRSARLVPVPASAIELLARALGRREAAVRLCGSLEVDIDKTRALLGWRPPVAMDEALRRTAQHFDELGR